MPNAGAATARNRGAAALTTDWMAFLDSDDYWATNHLERIADAIEQTEGHADLYFADTRRTDDEGGALLWDLAGFQVDSTFEMVEDAVDWVMLPRQPFMLQSSVIRRSRYLQVGGLWPALRSRHDTHLFFILGIGAPFCAVANVGVTMTSDDRSGTRQMDAMGWGSAPFATYSALLYGDVLTSFPDLSKRYRRQLKRRQCEGLLKSARYAYSDHHLGRGLADLARATWADPGRVVAAGLRPGGLRRRSQP
jgi:glycosyltransferase involved in cell wall biosynthesis